jgi:hypothetical protein
MRQDELWQDVWHRLGPLAAGEILPSKRSATRKHLDGVEAEKGLWIKDDSSGACTAQRVTGSWVAGPMERCGELQRRWLNANAHHPRKAPGPGSAASQHRRAKHLEIIATAGARRDQRKKLPRTPPRAHVPLAVHSSARRQHTQWPKARSKQSPRRLRPRSNSSPRTPAPPAQVR